MWRWRLIYFQLFFVFVCVMIIAGGCAIMLLEVMDMNEVLDKTINGLNNQTIEIVQVTASDLNT